MVRNADGTPAAGALVATGRGETFNETSSAWAAVDGDGRRKPLWYALRRAYADRLLTIQPRDGGLAVVAVNEGGAAGIAGEEHAKPSVLE